jgi:myo-inositol-1(or 4)-monophosphatase
MPTGDHDPTTASPHGSELLQVAVEAAGAAADVLLAHYEQTALEVRTKSTATDPVSEADEAAERAIRDVLTARRPQDGVLGEEGGDHIGTSGLRWAVDPLDGTVNFLFGVPQWCVSVACEGRAAAILDPLRRELFTVVAGEEARLDGRGLRGSRREELATALVSTGFGYRAGVRARQAEVLARLLPRVRDVRRFGSAALDLAWTAAGRYDAYYERGLNRWDVAAGELMCRAAGLEVRDLQADGELPPGLLVAAPALIEPLVELVA